MKIELPSISEQQDFILQEETKEAIEQHKLNLLAPRYPFQKAIDSTIYPNTHLLRENEGWEAPNSEVVKAYFRHFQTTFPQYGTDAKLAVLLGMLGGGNDRRIRAFKDGSKKVPYGIWRRFLVVTGQVTQEVIPVICRFE